MMQEFLNVPARQFQPQIWE